MERSLRRWDYKSEFAMLGLLEINVIMETFLQFITHHYTSKRVKRVPLVEPPRQSSSWKSSEPPVTLEVSYD